MESDLQQRHHYQLNRHQKNMNSGLTRYQSAPSSYFSSFQDRDSLEEFLNRPTSPETERIFSGFLQSSGSNSNVDSFLDQSFLEKKPEIKVEQETETTTTTNQKQNLQSHNQNQIQHNSGSNLLRQSSSPAGFFSRVDIENDNKPSYSAGLPPRTLSGGLNRSGWEDSSLMSDTSSAQKTLKKRGRTLSVGLDVSETKNTDAPKRPPLAHHRSLPKSLSEIEELMESSDSVAWKIRAKRGCATHPRSIAERVRRTRISERIKKLQDLVPNMDKQTNTAEMLDLAVEYIKDLQTQIKILSENRAKCTCSRMQRQ